MSYHATGDGCVLIEQAKVEQAYLDIHDAWLADFPTFNEIFEAQGFEVSVENGYSIIHRFSGNVRDEQKKLMEIIAPYVTEDSFMSFHGEDGSLWRWSFNDGEMHEVSGRIVWDDEE